MSNQLANDCRLAAEVMEQHGTFPTGQSILMDAAKALEVKDKTLAEMSEKLLRTERNRDMWKGQVERQSEKISNMRAALAQIAAHEPRTDHNGNLNDLIAVRSVETARAALEATR